MTFSRLQNKKILIVDDNPVNILIVQRMLEQVGCRIMTAADGIGALERLEQCQYDAVLMDLDMPIMDGLTATMKIRAAQDHTTARTPVIALTARDTEADIRAAQEAGMSHYLTKPVDQNRLLEAVHQAVANQTASIPLNTDTRR